MVKVTHNLIFNLTPLATFYITRTRFREIAVISHAGLDYECVEKKRHVCSIYYIVLHFYDKFIPLSLIYRISEMFSAR